MDSTVVRGKDVLIKQSPVTIYESFSDLTRFAGNFPEDLRDKITVNTDSISANLSGFNLGVKVDQKVPFSLVSFKEDGQAPFHFSFSFHFEPVGFDSTLFHIEMSAELNPMMKMMIGGKLQDMVDKFTGQIEKSMEGQAPDISSFKPENFS